jgi:hypothetical protein
VLPCLERIMMNSFPAPPVEPIYKHTSHTFHLIMTVCTFGMWAILVWWWWGLAQNSSNNRKRKKYATQMAEYQQARWAWEQGHQHPQQYGRGAA